MTRSGAARLSEIIVTLVVTIGCAPPPEPPDLDNPDAGPDPNAPLLLSITPDDGDEDVDTRPIFHLRFDRHIDAATLESNRFSLESGPARGHGIQTLYNPTEKEVLVWPGWHLMPESTWVFSVKSGILGTNEAQITPGVLATFRTSKESENKTPYLQRGFQNEIMPIFNHHCTSCHGGAGAGIAELKLDNKENILETAISVAATGRQEWKRIAPARPGKSYLLYKLTSDELIAGLRMPRTIDGSKSPPQLNKEEKTALFDWIATGAHFVDP